MPSRRAFLAAAAVSAAAGCLDSNVGETARPNENSATVTTGENATARDAVETRRMGESYETDEYAVRVSNPRVRHGIVEFGTTHPDPRWESGAQFLVVDLSVDGGRDPANLDVSVDTDLGSARERHFVHSTAASETLQPIGFPIPVDEELTRASVRWHGVDPVQWRVPDDVVSRLTRAPDFSLESFDVPATAPAETDVQVSLTVGNGGDRTGRFLAELGPAALSDQPEVELSVPVGETRATTTAVPIRFFERNEADVVLRWAGGTERRTVQRA